LNNSCSVPLIEAAKARTKCHKTVGKCCFSIHVQTIWPQGHRPRISKTEADTVTVCSCTMQQRQNIRKRCHVQITFSSWSCMVVLGCVRLCWLDVPLFFQFGIALELLALGERLTE
jgi:hypothetical protein